MDENEQIKRFSFKHYSAYMQRKSKQNNIIPMIPTTMPNKSYIYNVVKNQQNQTLLDISIGLGWENEISQQCAFEFGKYLNMVIPQRDFQKVENDYNGTKMKVRLYHYYEIPFIVCMIYAYFDILHLIPKHWLYAFYEETNISYIVYNLFRSNITFNDSIRNKLEELSHNRNELYNLEKHIYNMCPQVFHKNKSFKYYVSINAKYALAIELFILDYLSNS